MTIELLNGVLVYHLSLGGSPAKTTFGLRVLDIIIAADFSINRLQSWRLKLAQRQCLQKCLCQVYAVDHQSIEFSGALMFTRAASSLSMPALLSSSCMPQALRRSTRETSSISAAWQTSQLCPPSRPSRMLTCLAAWVMFSSIRFS